MFAGAEGNILFYELQNKAPIQTVKTINGVALCLRISLSVLNKPDFVSFHLFVETPINMKKIYLAESFENLHNIQLNSSF